MKRRMLIGLGAAMAMLGLAGCGGSGGGGTSGGGSSDPILVGYYGDLTGNTATFGKSTQDGVNLAVEEINQAPPLGRKIEIRSEDDQGKPDQASSVVTKLVTQDQVVAVLGEVASSRSLAAAPICQKEKIPMISPSSTNEQVTETGEYIFRICFIDPFQGSVMAKFARETLKGQTAAVLTDVKNDYSKGLAKSFKAKFLELGGRIVAEQSYSEGDINFNAQLGTIRQAAPDLIFVPGYYTEVGTIGKQARGMGIKVPLLGGDGWDSPELFASAGNALEGCYFSNHYSAQSEAPEIQEFIKRFKAKFNNRTPDAMAALGYDAAKILAEAIKTAGAADGPAIQQALAKIKDYPGVTGVITIDEHRNAKKPAVVLQIKGKEYSYVETVQP